MQLVIAAHQHEFRYDAPAADRPWAQIVGGGPNLDPANPKSFPTVIEGKVADGNLIVTVHDVLNGKVVGEYGFA